MPVIGGRAHLNGITFATSTHVVRGKLKKGELTFQVQILPHYRWIEVMDKVPFLRGISRLTKINFKIFLFIFLFLAVPWEWIFPSGQGDPYLGIWYGLGIDFLVLVAAVFLLKRLWQYHGAEHKVFNIYISGHELLLESVENADRVSNRCGTNLVVILLPMMFVLSLLLNLDQVPLLLYLVSLSLGYEIFTWSVRKKRLQIVFKIAAFIQKYIVTAEPTDEQLELAIATIKKAIEVEMRGDCVI